MTTPSSDSRELDAWLAEHLFGWAFWEEKRPKYTHVYWSTDGRDPWLRTQRAYQQPERYRRISWLDYDPQHHIYEGRRPEFSSTYEGMGLVLEAMRERGYEFSIGTTAVDRLIHAWFMPARDAIYINSTPLTAEGQSWNAEMPMAVALAARAAIESEASPARVLSEGGEQDSTTVPAERSE